MALMKHARLLALTAVAPLVFAGCGNSASSTGSASNSPDPTETPVAATSAPSPADQTSIDCPSCSKAPSASASTSSSPATQASTPSTPVSVNTTPTTVASSAPQDQSSALRQAATSFNDALLGNKPKEAHALLSAGCQKRVPLADMTAIAKTRNSEYGGPQKMTSFKAQVDGKTALLTYTYDKNALNRQMEPWVLEAGGWRMDDCQA